MITNTAFRWSTRDVVLHTITFKHLHVTAVHLHWNRDDQLPLGIFQYVPHGKIEIEIIGRTIELLFRNLIRVEVFLKRLLGRHAISFWQEWGSESGSNPMRCGHRFQASGNPRGDVVSKKPSS